MGGATSPVAAALEDVAVAVALGGTTTTALAGATGASAAAGAPPRVMTKTTNATTMAVPVTIMATALAPTPLGRGASNRSLAPSAVGMATAAGGGGAADDAGGGPADGATEGGADGTVGGDEGVAGDPCAEANGASASERACTLSKRWPGSFARHRATMLSRASGTSGRLARSCGVGPWAMFAKTAARVGPSNAPSAVSSSKSTPPRAQTSVRASSDPGARNCSGAMKRGEPRSAFSWLSVASSGRFCSDLTMPKSSTLTTRRLLVPTSARNRLAGLRSRCTRPSSWAAPTPSQACRR